MQGLNNYPIKLGIAKRYVGYPPVTPLSSHTVSLLSLGHMQLLEVRLTNLISYLPSTVSVRYLGTYYLTVLILDSLLIFMGLNIERLEISN